MGDAQSAQREDEKDAAAAAAEEEEEESGDVDDAQAEANIQDKPLKNKRKISEFNGKADSPIVEVICEDAITAEAILLPDEDVPVTKKLLKEETPSENVEMNEKESPTEADADEDASLEITEMDAKQNDINESFRRFFSNIGLKFTVKKGSGTDVPNETNEDEPNRPEDVEDTAKETTCENAEQNTDVTTAQETDDNDSTTCPTLTEGTAEDFLENAEEKTTETKEEGESDNAHAVTTSPGGEDAHQDATPEEEPPSESPPSPEEEVVVSPIKRFFTTGIFSGLRKKKKPAEDEATDKELKDMGKEEVGEKTEGAEQDQQQDMEEISWGVEAGAVEKQLEENEPKEEIPSTAQTTDASTIAVTDPEILSSQEKDKVPASPLKRLLSGSSLKKLSKKQRGRKSSDAKLSDSGEHVSDQLLSSTESAENQNEEGCAQPSVETAAEEDGAWASFKKLLTPKRRMKKPSLSNEETQIPGSVEEPKPSEGGQISDHSTEEGKKRKDSSVSWESVLCGSGRRRSRKTSDSEEETPQTIDKNMKKQDGGSKHSGEWGLENEVNEMVAHSPKQAGSPSEGDVASPWKSLKRLVTPKRKAKDDDETKDNAQSDSEVNQDESFSMKKLLPGRKKRKSPDKHDQVSSDEADKDAALDDEDSDTPAVVPLSEFDTVETEVHIQTGADLESHKPKEADYEQDPLDQTTEPVLPCDGLQTEAKNVQDNDDAFKEASKTPATNEEPDDLTDSISKQQLSDIPEEATPASVTEEAARDDTIAEDLIEITSEAVTAPEPLDITLADETEMISAVSQLCSESSKTSGNTTPVLAEYVFVETDVLLHQVVETISVSPKAVPVCSDEPRSERIVVSVSQQILEKCVEEEPTILEKHRRFDATIIDTGLRVEPLEAVNELAVTVQTESVPEVNNSVATETVSIPTEEFDTADMSVDEVHEVDITNPEESMKELESIDESHHLVECLSEEDAALCTDILPGRDEIAPDDGSLVEAYQTETETQKLNSQEADSSATNETTDGAMEQEGQSLTKKEDQIVHNLAGQIQAEDKEQPTIEAKESQVSAAVQAATLDSEEGSAQSLEKDVISEDTSTAETVTYELKEETVPVPEVSDEQETKELPLNAIKTVQETEVLEAVQSLDASKTEHVQEPEASEVVQASTLDSEDGGIQSPSEEVRSEDIPPSETITDEQEQTSEHLTEVNNEPENNANVINTVQAPEALVAVQAPILDSEAGSLLSLVKEVIPEDIPAVETLTYEHKQEADVEAEEKLQVEAEVTESIEEGSTQILEKQILLEDVPKPSIDNIIASVTDGLGGEVVTQLDHSLEKAEDQITKSTPQDSGAELKDHIHEVTDELQTACVSSINVEESDVQVLGKTALMEKSLAPCEDDVAVNNESKDEVLLSAVQVGVEVESEFPSTEIKTADEHAVVAQVVICNFKEVSAEIPDVLMEITSPITEPLVEIETSELVFKKEVETATPLVKTDDVAETAVEGSAVVMMQVPSVVDVSKIEYFHKPEVLETVQAPASDSEEGSVQSVETEAISENVPEEKIITDDPKEEIMPLTEANLEPVDATKTEHVQEPEILEAVQALTSDSEVSSLLSLEKEVISEDIPAVEILTDEPKQETDVKAEEKLPVEEAVKTEVVQEPEVLEAVQAPTSDPPAGSLLSLEKEVISEDIPVVEILTDEPKQEAEVKAEEKLPVEEAVKTEDVQEPEVLEAVQAPTSDPPAGSLLSLEKEVISEDISVVETLTDEPKQEAEVKAEEKLPVEEAVKKEDGQEPEVLEAVQAPTSDSEVSSLLSLEKEVISEDIPAVETFTDEPKQEAEVKAEEKLPVEEAVKKEDGQEPEVLEAVQAPTSDSEVSSLLSLEKEVMSEDIPAVEILTDEPKQEADIKAEEKLPVEEAVKTEDVQEPEVLEAVQAPTSDSPAGSLLSLEKEVISEDIPVVETLTDEPKQEAEVKAEEKLPVEAVKTEDGQEPELLPSDIKDNVPETKTEATFIPTPCVDNAEVSNEPKHEVHLSAMQVNVEVEKECESPDTDIKTADEHAVVASVVICHFKELSAEIPDVLIENTSPITETLVERGSSELVFKKEVETATPLVNDDVAETAVEGSVVVMMQVPSAVDEDNYRMNVQVVNADIELAEKTVDTLEVQITEFKKVLDVCHETLKKLDNLSATPETEEELINEEDNVTIQEVIQHVKEHLPETAPESVGVNLDQEGSIATSRERLDEAPTVISNVSEQQVSEDLTQTADIPGSLDISTRDQKVQSKVEQEKSEAAVAAEEVKANQIFHEGARIIQSPIAPPRNIGFLAPQNTGKPSKPSEQPEVAVQATETTELATNLDSTKRAMITTQTILQVISNQAVEPVEPIESTEGVTSSVQAKESASPPPPTDRFEDEAEPVKPNKQIERTEDAVQATETIEPLTNSYSTERAMIVTQTVLLAASNQVMEPVEQIGSTESVTFIVQDTMQPVRQTALSGAHDQKTNAGGLVKEKDEDQDVWMDAEEDICTQEGTEVFPLKVEEFLEPQTKSEQEEKAGVEDEVEANPESKKEEQISQLKMHTTVETCGTDSEEDFAVALEHPEAESVSVTTMEGN